MYLGSDVIKVAYLPFYQTKPKYAGSVACGASDGALAGHMTTWCWLCDHAVAGKPPYFPEFNKYTFKSFIRRFLDFYSIQSL